MNPLADQEFTGVRSDHHGYISSNLLRHLRKFILILVNVGLNGETIQYHDLLLSLRCAPETLIMDENFLT